MRRIMEVLRLAAQGLSYRQISQSLGISASTIQGYVKRAQNAGLSWPLPDDVDALALEARLFKRGEEEPQSLLRRRVSTARLPPAAASV